MQIKKLSLYVLIFLFTVSSAYALFHKEKWDGWVYPNADDLTNYVLAGKDFKSLEDCRDACLRIISNAGYQNADYECGLNCKPRSPGADVFVCKKTLR